MFKLGDMVRYRNTEAQLIIGGRGPLVDNKFYQIIEIKKHTDNLLMYKLDLGNNHPSGYVRWWVVEPSLYTDNKKNFISFNPINHPEPSYDNR